MPYKITEHTADLRIIAKGKTIKELFLSAMIGISDFLKPELFEPKITLKRAISVESVDKTALLVDFLNEIITLSQINKETYSEIIFKKFSETALEAELRGFKIKKFKKDIKAVTYHEAKIIKNRKGEWETPLVFDI